MKKEEAEQRPITVYWWNRDKKTLDFKGELKDFLKKKDIKVRSITAKNGNEGYRFKMSLYATVATLDVYDTDYINCADRAITTFLTLLGDKAIYHTPYGREYKLNWN